MCKGLVNVCCFVVIKQETVSKGLAIVLLFVCVYQFIIFTMFVVCFTMFVVRFG